MARRSTPGQDRALAAFARQLDVIKHHFADGDERPDGVAGAAQTTPATLISIDQWGTLLSAVKARLRQTVGELVGRDLDGTPAAVRIAVLECVDALDLLHVTLGHALSRDARIDWRDTDCAEATGASRFAVQPSGSGVPVSTMPLPNFARAAVAIN